MPSPHLSRRGFVIQALLGCSALAGSGAFARTITGEIPWLPGEINSPAGLGPGRFLTQTETEYVSAIVSRLIPSDESGPGAREANVTGFIDRQLAGFYGRGERWYMQGPHPEGTKQQGYQSEYPPALLYRHGIAALDAHCQKAFGGKRFPELAEQEQDAVLKDLEAGKIKFDGVSATLFFEIVMENAIEGFFCDPIYGGNRDMIGWRLVGFPGARYDYRDFLNHDGARIDIEPVGLQGRPAWNPS